MSSSRRGPSGGGSAGRDRAQRRRDTIRERRAHRAARREELLDAAVDAIRRHGPGASMEQIAAAAGVTKPVLYRHVGGRDALVTGLTDRFIDDLTGRLRSVLERDDASPGDQVVAGIDAYLELIETDTNLYRFLVHRVGSQPGGAEVLSEVIRQIAHVTVNVIGEGLREAGGDSGAAEPWGYGLVGMVHAAGDWWLENRTMPRQRLVEYLASMAWEGMGGAAAAEEAHPQEAAPAEANRSSEGSRPPEDREESP